MKNVKKTYLYFSYSMAFCLILSLIWGSLTYQRYTLLQNELYHREIQIFTNHVQSTIRAVEASDPKLLNETLIRLNTLGAFRSDYMQNDTTITRLINTYIGAVINIKNNGTTNEQAIKTDLNNLSNTLMEANNSRLNKNKMDELINKLIPIVEDFEIHTETNKK